MERVYLVFLSLLLYITLSASVLPPGQNAIPCVAVEAVDDLIHEDFDFRIQEWEKTNVSVVSNAYNLPPMSGPYTYHYSFCNSLNIYMGDNIQDPKNVFGWSFGVLTSFVAYDINPGNASHEFAAFMQFTQIYDFGDAGSPCTEEIPRSATINIYCGIERANCTQVPGNIGAQCLNPGGVTTPGFCLCSIHYNASVGLCKGLTLNLLSNKCPHGRAIGSDGSGNPQDVSRMVGIAFAFLGVFIMVAIIGGYIYNFTVHSKRGCQAIPFYDTCTGKKAEPTYTSSPPTSDVLPPSVPVTTPSGYGSI